MDATAYTKALFASATPSVSELNPQGSEAENLSNDEMVAFETTAVNDFIGQGGPAPSLHIRPHLGS